MHPDKAAELSAGGHFLYDIDALVKQARADERLSVVPGILGVTLAWPHEMLSEQECPNPEYVVVQVKKADYIGADPEEVSVAVKFLGRLRYDPLPKGVDLKKMRDSRGSWRIRAGNLRIIYQIVPEKKQVWVLDVDYRGGVYKH